MRHWAGILLAAALGAAAPIGQGEQGIARFKWFEYAGEEPVSARSSAEYHNPVLQGFYPDPSLIRVGDDYYLSNSTFAYFPGLPIFRSRDLVHWTQIGNAVDRADQFDFTELGVSEGLFAPSISEHGGKWYLVNVCVGCGGNFVIEATNPAGPWSKPKFIRGLDGAIDPSLFFDDDGSAWLVFNAPPLGKPKYEGHRAIFLQRFDPSGGETTSEPVLLLDAGIHPERKPIWIEGPHIFKKDGLYYLIAAEGGTAENHSEVVLRSQSVLGPYQPGPSNPILTQRDLARRRAAPITSAGHASFVTTPQGDWWAAFLATRPYADGFYNTGRETFLLPVTWDHGWPAILPKGAAVPVLHQRPALPMGTAGPVPTSGSFKVLDKFDRRALPPYWMMLRTPHERWYALAGDALEVRARGISIGSRGNPSFLGRRQQHANATASTELHFAPAHDGELAGLVAIQNESHWYFVGLIRHGNSLVVSVERRGGPNEPADGTTLASIRYAGTPGAPLYLKIAARSGFYDFYYAGTQGQWIPLLKGADGTLLSTKRSGGFVGTMLGVYAYDPSLKGT